MNDAPRTVCYYLQTPLERRDYERFGVEVWRSRGWRVVLLDLSVLLFPGSQREWDHIDGMQDAEMVRAQSWDDVRKFVREQRDAIAVCFLSVTRSARFLFQEFRRWKVSYALFQANTIPTPCFRWDERWSLLRSCSLKTSLGREFFDRVYRWWPSLFGRISSPRYLLRGGTGETTAVNKIETETIWAHTLDYDIFLKGRKDFVAPGLGAVFIDENISHDRDQTLLYGINRLPHPEDYYPALNRFFSWVEERWGMPVRIAAAPRSLYENGPNPYAPREVVKHKTNELIAQANIVLTHGSTAVNFAVLHHKPLLFITLKVLDRTVRAPSIRAFAGAFDQRPLYVDDLRSLETLIRPEVRPSVYTAYRERYIKKSGTPEEPFWTIVSDRWCLNQGLCSNLGERES